MNSWSTVSSQEFAWANVTREEAETAVKAAYAENEVFKHDVQMEGLKHSPT